MTVYQVQLLEPKAKALLENLASLKLIRLQKFEPPKLAFRDLLEMLASREEAAQLSGEELTQAVEALRLEKQKQKPRPRFGSAKGMFVMSPDLDKLLENDPSGFGCLKDRIQLAPDWDEPLEDFKEYMY